MEKFYKDFNFGNVKDKKQIKQQELVMLYEKPKKETYAETPHFNQTYAANVDHQADLLFLPNDNGYRYCLVVTDIGNRLSDAEPLKNKSSKTVKDSLKIIYKRGILKKPQTLTMDSGKEFKGEVLDYLKKNGIAYKYAKPGRHRQVAMVERTNQYLGKGLFMRMQAQELLTGQTSKEWVSDLPKFIKYINKQRKRKLPKPVDEVKCSGNDCKLLEIGTKVRVKLDNPIDYVTDKKLHGNFRVTDIRWDPHPRIINNIMLMPGQPPMYQLNDEKDVNKIDTTAAYTKGQLQVVNENEEAPNPKVIRGKPTTYIVQRLVDKKKMKNKIYYRVRWKGYSPDQDTWETRKALIEDVPLLVKEYELKNK
jgi:hypothetical protein